MRETLHFCRKTDEWQIMAWGWLSFKSNTIWQLNIGIPCTFGLTIGFDQGEQKSNVHNKIRSMFTWNPKVNNSPTVWHTVCVDPGGSSVSSIRPNIYMATSLKCPLILYDHITTLLNHYWPPITCLIPDIYGHPPQMAAHITLPRDSVSQPLSTTNSLSGRRSISSTDEVNICFVNDIC